MIAPEKPPHATNVNAIALDSSAAVQWLRQDQRVRRWLLGFDRVFLPVVALGEIRFGADNSDAPREGHAAVDVLAATCDLLDVTAAVATEWSRIRLDLRRKGRPIPDNDLWIAATCLVYEVPLATTDRHFDGIEGLDVRNLTDLLPSRP